MNFANELKNLLMTTKGVGTMPRIVQGTTFGNAAQKLRVPCDSKPNIAFIFRKDVNTTPTVNGLVGGVSCIYTGNYSRVAQYISQANSGYYNIGRGYYTSYYSDVNEFQFGTSSNGYVFMKDIEYEYTFIYF